MRRNLKIGLILGTALLMLLPVYKPGPTVYLTQLTGEDDVAGTAVSISATQLQQISFTINSSLSSPQFSSLTLPPGATL